MATVNLGPIMTQILNRYGLSGMGTWLSQRITEGATLEEIEIELYDRPEFKAAFPEIEARRALAQQQGVNLRPLSPDEILDYRTQARGLMRSMGLPPSFYTANAAFFELLVNDVSLDELQWRLDNATARVAQAPPEVRAVFGELFGGAALDAIYALFVDPDRAVPELENILQTAEAGGAARRFGFDLTQSQMTRLEQQNLTYGQLTQGFAALDVTRSLFDETLYEEVDDFEVGEEGIAGAFGLEGGAAERLERRGQTRAAQTQGSSGGAIDQYGASGFGVAGQR
jgi:hypothetical protein